MLNILGIDIGSVAVSVAVLNRKKEILKSVYRFHHGAIKETLAEIFDHIQLSSIGAMVVTSSTPSLLNYSKRYDSQMATITAVSHFHKELGSILFVGGENVGLITFDEEGSYESYKSNTSCAAGTGSFLDQQAKRLNLKSIETLSQAAFCNEDEVPKIATRCAVFAKTDLIHAQQEGYTVGQISDGLCEGLAKNIIDTLVSDDSIRKPVIFAGGVSMNQAVEKHLAQLLGTTLQKSETSHLYGAVGAALLFINEEVIPQTPIGSVSELFKEMKFEKSYGFEPLDLKLSRFPDFVSLSSYEFTSKNEDSPVEVDIYEAFEEQCPCFLGIDIGSTSTKAVLLSQGKGVLAGFYTKTAGNPIKAVQNIFEAIDDVSKNKQCQFIVLGAGTTGSGRKFIGKIMGADSMVDEITAHARAAFELDPEVDTIIEIGGQDAKFTTMENGMVTSSVMNNVCAAGTGSFIEEQAHKLGCPITEYAQRAMMARAPVSSDRCTVFMERDINHYLSDGYSVDEVLASVLHSVRENYLTKVAVEANIGDRIFFQGATAKNKALVAAFEQKLGKPILVSKFCHLTGALGTALLVAENSPFQSTFRGISLYKEEIPVESEVCELCRNSCKIKKVTVHGDTVAFGFLCGRDYETKKYVDQKSGNFDLLKERAKVFSRKSVPRKNDGIVVGIPSALYLSEEHVLWQNFFANLGINTFSSKDMKDPIKVGKKVAESEFCAPMSAFYGHVKYLSEKVDLVFLPVYLEGRLKPKDSYRHLCYYTQFAASLASKAKGIPGKTSFLMPLIEAKSLPTKIELFKALKPLGKSYWSISSAYDQALESFREGQEKVLQLFNREQNPDGDIQVVLLGRPYTILEKSMNKGIPGIFSNLGITCFFQDMLEYSAKDVEEIDELLHAVHWNYAAKILETALIVSKTEGLYPVYMSSFKCGPDSFVMEYFKRIMRKRGKPYLVLELDEHDSSVGYETRIEAAIRSFRNHKSKPIAPEPVVSDLVISQPIETSLNGKTLLFPSWDDYCAQFIEAILKKEGIDCRVVPCTEKAVMLGPRTNTGQCIPVNIMAQSFIDYILDHQLDPANTLVWAFHSIQACNIAMYPQFIQNAFEAHGGGMEKTRVYRGSLTMTDISLQVSIDSYFAYMFGGTLRKMACKIRPYEIEKGQTDQTLKTAAGIFYDSFSGKRSREEAVEEVVRLFKSIPVLKEERPKIAIFGDMYARDNDVLNQNLIQAIEDAGGEAITTPFSDLAKMIVGPYIKRWIKLGYYKDAIQTKAIVSLVSILEKNYLKLFNEVLHEEDQAFSVDLKKVLEPFNVKIANSGESVDNLIKVMALKEHYPDLSLFIQANPGFCCAGHVTEAMASIIEEVTGVPIVTLNYDGTGKYQNDKIIPYIKFPRRV